MPSPIPDHSQSSVDNHTIKRPIPKFSSFQPKATLPNQISKEGSQTDRDLTPDVSGRHQASRHRRERRIHERPKSPKDDVALGNLLKPTISNNEVNKDASLPFAVDKAGDLNNITFGTLHRYSTPSYFRFGSGKVIGSPSEQNIDRSISTEKHVVLTDRYPRPSEKWDRKGSWQAVRKQTKQLKIRPQAKAPAAIGVAPEFVSLGNSDHNASKSSIDVSTSSGEEDSHYRSVAGKAKSKDVPDDKDLIYDTDSSSSGEKVSVVHHDLEKSTQKRRAILSKRVDAEPVNHTAWLDLIAYQDDISGASRASKKSSFTKAEKRSNAEVKLSMYEKALENVKDPTGQEILLLGKMEEAAQVWDESRLSSEWKWILQNFPAYIGLWTRYLDFKQTAFVLFRYEEVHRVYLECLDLLKNSCRNPKESIQSKERIVEIQIYVLLRMTLFMRESGFVEQAVAAWQALLEYVFFAPFSVKRGGDTGKTSGRQEALSSFEDFWDSEVPRLGEEGWESWATFHQRQGEAPEPKVEATEELDISEDIWASWLQSEQRRGHSVRTPARTIDDVVENDPYRVILYSDIQTLLLDPPSIASRPIILDAFLVFCHLPPPQAEGSDNSSRSRWRDSYVQNAILCIPHNALHPLTSSPPPQRDLENLSTPASDETSGLTATKLSQSSPLVFDYQVTSDTLFAPAESWFSVFNTWQLEYSNDQGPVEKSWVLRSLKSLVSAGIGDDSFAEYLLALELCTSPQTVRKTARGLLKKQSSNLRLYNAYALVECHLGDKQKGENVIVNSINMSKKLDELAQREALLLWRTWTWELLDEGKAREALTWLSMYGDEELKGPKPTTDATNDQGTNPALLLRTTRALVATRDHCISDGDLRHAALAAECLVLHDYLKTSQSLSAAVISFRSNFSLLSSTNSYKIPAHESFHQSFARLLHHHATHAPLVKPSALRPLLSESMTAFPHNTLFKSLNTWNEARFGFNDRIRSIIQEISNSKYPTSKPGPQNTLEPQETLPTHLLTIHTELSRPISLGSTPSTIRSTFEHALQSPSGTHCAGLYKLYFLFEHSRGNIDRAKNVFWRGVKACPWVKELYLLAFGYLRGVGGFKDGELRGVYEGLGERGLRIHVGLEEVFEGWDERRVVERGQ